MLRNLTLAAAVFAALPALAHDGLVAIDPYIRSAPPTAPTAAAFMTILNHTDAEVHVTGVASEIAARVELHTHRESGDGVMRMIPLEDGFRIPAGGSHELRRGADHVMFMGLDAPLEQGAEVEITFTFADHEPLTVIVPVDHQREAENPAHDGIPHGEGAMTN